MALERYYGLVRIETVEMNNEWINGKNQLPEKDPWKVYAVLTNEPEYHKYQMAWFEYSSKKFKLEKGNICLKVKYWMPLPEPPK